MRRSTLTVAVGAAFIALYLALPGDVAKNVVYSVVGLAATVCLALSQRSRSPEQRRGWTLLAVANGLFVVGDAILSAYDVLTTAGAPSPSVADALYLAGYPFLFAGVYRVTRRRGDRTTREAWADASIVAVGATALFWQLLMRPYATDETRTAIGRLVMLTYPMMDLGILFILVSAVLSPGRRRACDQLLGVAVVAMLFGDFGFDLYVLQGPARLGDIADVMFLVNYVLLAAAALHPSSRHALDESAESVIARSHAVWAGRRGWMPLVAAAGFVSPGMLLAGQVLHFPVDTGVLAGISIVLFALVVARVRLLFDRITRQNELNAERSRRLSVALTAQRNLETDLRHQAFHDGLTGLANRALLSERIDHALARAAQDGSIVALCFCDLDGFKAVNDGLGHQVGDRLLTAAAERLASVVRDGDTIARLGGDEFAVLLEGLSERSAATGFAERLVEAFRRPIPLDDELVPLSISVGLAFGSVDASAQTTTEALLSEADSAMYEAKATGKDGYAVFEATMRARLMDELTLRNAFAPSLERGEFTVVYQPQISLTDNQLLGFEALVRWQHRDLGPISPDRFIPLAESTGFIVPLGRWVLDTACVQARLWSQLTGTPVTMSVNLSARQLQDAGLVADVRSALDFSGLAGEQLVLEITESGLMRSPANAARTLAELKNLGIRIAIDDFGTGYSSLSYLRDFPVDILKIDKSFIDPLDQPGHDAEAFVRSILGLAADLGLHTTAEGVEREGQRDALVRLGCDGVQGYLFARPLLPEDALEFAQLPRWTSPRRATQMAARTIPH